MIAFRLGVIGLSDPERSLVATLLRLHGVDDAFQWTLVDAAPFDALLIDATCGPEDHRHLTGARTQVMRLSGHGSPRGGEMPRPIRSDLLVEWLANVERAWPPAAVPVRSQGTPLSTSSTSASVSAPISAAPSGVPVCRLRRWPSPQWLGRDHGRIRVATMLARRAMSLDEVASLSRVPLASCRHWMTELQHHGWLEVASLAGGADAVRVPPQSASTTTRSRGVGAALIQSLRRRFGFR